MWQNADGSVCGYPAHDAAGAAARTMLRIDLSPKGDPDGSGFDGADATAIVRRLQLADAPPPPPQ
eukprot:183963-Chlamydomonas_euryale.AAC.1